MTNCKGSYSINTFTRFVNLSFGRFQFLQYQYNDPAPANDRTIKELDFSFAPSRYNLWTHSFPYTIDEKQKWWKKKKKKRRSEKSIAPELPMCFYQLMSPILIAFFLQFLAYYNDSFSYFNMRNTTVFYILVNQGISLWKCWTIELLYVTNNVLFQRYLSFSFSKDIYLLILMFWLTFYLLILID